MRACLAEFFACLLFTYMGPGSVVAMKGSGTWGGGGVVGYSLAFGLCITVLAYGIGDISGGHINPAVTLSMVVTKNMKPATGLCYFVSQCLGAIVGGGLLKASVGDLYHSGIGLNPSLEAHNGLMCEFMGTFLLIFTVFFVAVEHSNRKDDEDGLDMASESSIITALAPLPIGFAVLVAHLVIGPMTGCGINPARVIGAVVWCEENAVAPARSCEMFPSYHWIYWVGPFLASVAAPAVYFLLYGTLHNTTDEGSKSKVKVANVSAVTSIEK